MCGPSRLKAQHSGIAVAGIVLCKLNPIMGARPDVDPMAFPFLFGFRLQQLSANLQSRCARHASAKRENLQLHRTTQRRTTGAGIPHTHVFNDSPGILCERTDGPARKQFQLARQQKLLPMGRTDLHATEYSNTCALAFRRTSASAPLNTPSQNNQSMQVNRRHLTPQCGDPVTQ